jgi:hypothetical protein
MPGKRAENRKLKDVKAALQSLQRIDLNSSAPIELRHEQPEAKKSPVQGRRLGAFALALIAVGTVIVLASDLFFKYWPPTVPGGKTADTDNKISAPPGGDAGQGNSASGLPVKTAQPAKPQSAVESRTAPPVSAVPDPRIIPVLENARQLMDAGHIAAARKMLLQPALAASEDAAWLIARSFDPNYLATVQSADATADKGQAEEWYRRWRDFGAQNGVAMDDARFKRLIDAMR